jgi:hypothetical protein
MRNRRQLIKGIGASAIASLGLGTVAGAETENQTPYERSLMLRNQASWSNEQWRSYLTKVGIPHGYVQRTWNVPVPGGSGEVGTSGLAESELTATVTYSYPSYVSYDVVDFDWDFNESWDDTGSVPRDTPSLAWDDDHYSPTTARDDWVYYGDYAKDPETSNSKGPSGAVCAWSDAHDDDGYSSEFGCYVDPNTADYSSTERIIYFDFVHTWSDGEVDSIGFDGSGNVSISFTTTTERWDKEDHASESQLTDGESY